MSWCRRKSGTHGAGRRAPRNRIMNRIAEELNRVLDKTVAGRFLSDFGRRIYFPKGIIAQSAEAKKEAKTANGTIGMAFHNGKAVMLPALREILPGFKETEIVTYAPTQGTEAVRKLWRGEILNKNPGLRPDFISLPVLVPGITAGISYTADLFFDRDSVLIAGFPCWDNYSLIFEERRLAKFHFVDFFDVPGGAGGGLNLENIKEAVRAEAKSGPVRIILNFPNNPAGYSPTKAEVEALCGILLEAAEGGADVLVICDDAYFGLFYEEETCKESVFTWLSSLHERILAVKADGPTKEDYLWGLRTAFLTFGSKALTEEVAAALVEKLKGVIRSSVSCANTPAQTLLVKLYENPDAAKEKAELFGVLKEKYIAVRDFVAAHKSGRLQALPFNSGYFMSFVCRGFDAEKFRLELLRKHGIGVIALEDRFIRIAFSSLGREQIVPVLQTIYDSAETFCL